MSSLEEAIEIVDNSLTDDEKFAFVLSVYTNNVVKDMGDCCPICTSAFKDGDIYYHPRGEGHSYRCAHLLCRPCASESLRREASCAGCGQSFTNVDPIRVLIKSTPETAIAVD